MKISIYVVLVLLLAVSCTQTNEKEAKLDEDQKGILYKWNKCKEMEEILGKIRLDRNKHETNQAHMHRGNTAFSENDSMYFSYNNKIRGGNVTFYSEENHENHVGYFPFVVLDESVIIPDNTDPSAPQLHLNIDTNKLFRVSSLKNRNANRKGEYCMFIVTGTGPRTHEE